MSEEETETTPIPDPDRNEAPHERRRRAVEALRFELEKGADPGTLAALRRMNPSSPPPAFFRVMARSLDELLPKNEQLRLEVESRWAVVAQAMAMAIGPGKRGTSLLSRTSFGEALADADVAEMRVLRLLDASADQRADLLRGVVHQLVSKAQDFDPGDIAELVLTQGDAQERARRHIARSFYRHHEA